MLGMARWNGLTRGGRRACLPSGSGAKLGNEIQFLCPRNESTYRATSLVLAAQSRAQSLCLVSQLGTHLLLLGGQSLIFGTVVGVVGVIEIGKRGMCGRRYCAGGVPGTKFWDKLKRAQVHQGPTNLFDI
jgi:hypothetical protein